MPVRINLKRLVFWVLGALLLNWPWEIFHSVLYIQYQQGPITNFILFRASLVDAFLLVLILELVSLYKQRFAQLAVLVFNSLAVAILIERWALTTQRWQYASTMPLVPYLQVGLSPTLQLVVTALIVWQADYLFFKR